MPDLLQMADSLYRLRIPGDQAHLLNSYLWTEPDGVTLIDTGWPDSVELIADALTDLGLRRIHVKRIVLTHFHEDHCGAAAEIAGWSDVEVIAGAGDADFVRGEQLGPLPVLTESERTLRPDFDASPHGPACRVDRVVGDGDELDFAGGARVIGVPGHTPGSIALHLPAADAVLTGDVVAEFNGQVIFGVFNTDRSELATSIQRLADTGAQIAGFGHGEAILTGAATRIAAAADPFAS
ncbi:MULTISPECIES: MBL fold metallo-hydrolase [unclassified Mycolicibacterium]|uniref:MBL fold metallo-hydrolase n=1 Tax=unclassified Mycolicibacterium TaxID=2636767 RepID=UPI0012DD9141|nr:MULTISPECIES: MBL fold metallo-hydrolase [unclassified Mycolicibacterium]MUL84247.1 MBL fold metallo-hydrolase [Mycolicibacterium sp. CBMA 329]MUL89687.1 MBL fold metallo-hydrolase [Mycolicibacterium sp. CBMA 331]MUL99862.1 MBL fold metallo-hydrolase [Mycolicibacterium sp. CBMA 334]MUM27017.1 MBL fold metallo-hydrolase [Mycolicibacterium sp. CBMA 295]MUM39202.1 MBL fold metallo-hydrolase [Mycolicibacterium sp. CBMA 247]